jgi:hypothetical protein
MKTMAMAMAMAILIVLSGLRMAAQDMSSCPMHKDMKAEHQADVEKHGDEAMGSSTTRRHIISVFRQTEERLKLRSMTPRTLGI